MQAGAWTIQHPGASRPPQAAAAWQRCTASWPSPARSAARRSPVHSTRLYGIWRACTAMLWLPAGRWCGGVVQKQAACASASQLQRGPDSHTVPTSTQASQPCTAPHVSVHAPTPGPRALPSSWRPAVLTGRVGGQHVGGAGHLAPLCRLHILLLCGWVGGRVGGVRGGKQAALRWTEVRSWQRRAGSCCCRPAPTCCRQDLSTPPRLPPNFTHPNPAPLPPTHVPGLGPLVDLAAVALHRRRQPLQVLRGS